MEQTMTVPMSMAAVGYALFALQQSVPTNELKPIKFNLANGKQVGPGFIPQMGPSSTVVVDDENANAIAAPDGQAVAVDAGSGGPVVAAPMFGGSTGMFGGDLPGAMAFVAAEETPEEEVVEEVVEEVKAAPVAHDAPRAAQQIGLLKELSFLDS